jgi:hypothetical protein
MQAHSDPAQSRLKKPEYKKSRPQPTMNYEQPTTNNEQ